MNNINESAEGSQGGENEHTVFIGGQRVSGDSTAAQIIAEEPAPRMKGKPGRKRSPDIEISYPVDREFTLPELKTSCQYTTLYQRVQKDLRDGVIVQCGSRKNNAGRGAHVKVFKINNICNN